MESRIHLVAMIVIAVLAGSLVPAAASSPAAAQEQTSWYVNDNPRLFGPSQYWYWGDPGHGYGSNYYRYTYAIAGESSPDNWARWSMGRRVGRQEIQAYVPSNHATATVTYRIDVGGREYTRRVAQRNVSGWTSLGNVEADGARVTITVRDNEASQHHSRHGLAASRIGVDAIRMRCVARCSTSPPAPPASPAPQPPPPSPEPPPPPPPSRASAGACEPAGVLRGVAGAVSGIPSVEWDAGCVSGVRGNGDHYARRYRLDVRDAGEVTIELSSQTDTYLYLLDAQGDVIVEDDDGGSGTDSRIVRDLSVGSYLVEATTYRAGASGSFTLGVRVARSASPPPPPPPAPPPPPSRASAGACEPAGVLRGVAGAVSGIPSVEWDAGCVSGVRGNGDHYARRYRLDVRDAGEVTIELSSQTDTYLYLLDAQGDVIVEDDDGGSGTDSRIVRDLSVGSYLVEATTYRAGASGSFTLGVRVARSASPPPPPPPSSQGSGSSSGCGVVSLGAVGGSVSRGGVWAAGCESSQRSGRFARVFGFTLGAEREVTVDLESSVDAYLYLLDGQGRIVDEDDDGGSGLNSRITRTLAAGTYRVEATTYSSGASGSFTLGVRVGAGAPSSQTTPVLAMGDDARPSGRCSSPSCRWFRISNLRPGSRVECWRENMGAAYATFTASSETSTRNCYFSYVGARVYVVANGVRSNTITWPSAPVQPSPPPPSAQRASEPLSGCAVESLGTVGGSVSRGGAWAAGCESSQRSGRFARVFDFSLSGEREVTVDLESDVDTYLYLLDSRGRRIDEDDDGGSGLNSRITRTLAAGTYRVEATTYRARVTGDFTIEIRAARFDTEIDGFLSEIEQYAAETLREAVSASQTVDSLEERISGERVGDTDTVAGLTGQASRPVVRATSYMAEIETAKRGLIRELASMMGIRNSERSVRNPPLDIAADLLDYSESILSRLDHIVEFAEANVVWAEWGRIAAANLCSEWARATAREIISDAQIALWILKGVTLIPAAKEIVVGGLRGLARVTIGEVENLTIQWALNRILPEPLAVVVNAGIFLDPPDPPASLEGTDILPICDFENGVQVRLPLCSSRSGWQAFWEDTFSGSNCRRD
ncbi:MAG: pre-peptidase C-terminal domain-containing protein [bacterium]|nr:pre-peptidase C-terminal domain-containing protein [bacterium]